MRKLLGIALAGFLALSLAGSSGATTLSYTGTLTFQLTTLPALSATGSGTVSVNGTAGGPQLSRLLLGAGDLGPVTDSLPVTSNGTINSVIFTGLGNLSGSFSGLSNVPGGGPMGLAGTAKICLIFAPCAYANVTIPITPAGGTGLGIGGTQTFPGAVAVTLQHNPWTIGQPTMTIHTPASTISMPPLPGGFVHGPATGDASSAVANSGVLQLVTPTKAYTSLSGAFPEIWLFSIVKAHFFGLPTPTASPTPSLPPTATPTPSSPPTPTPTPSLPPTATPTPSLPPTATPTPSLPPTATPTPSLPPTATPTPVPHGTPTPSPSGTPLPTPTPSATPSPSPSPSATPTPGECRRECRAERRDCQRSAIEEGRMCRASCRDALESALESCRALPLRKRFRCGLRASVQYLRCLDGCQDDQGAALSSCRAEYRSCRADCR